MPPEIEAALAEVRERVDAGTPLEPADVSYVDELG